MDGSGYERGPVGCYTDRVVPVRISQERVEALRQSTTRNLRVTQAAVEQINQPNGQQNLRITQIAIEFPFPGPSVPPPPPPPGGPTPTEGDVTPAQCEPPPTAVCTTEPDLRSTPETCELLGS